MFCRNNEWLSSSSSSSSSSLEKQTNFSVVCPNKWRSFKHFMYLDLVLEQQSFLFQICFEIFMCLDLNYVGLGWVVLGLCLGLVQIKSMFYFMSVQSEVILNKRKEHISVYYTNLPTGPVSYTHLTLPTMAVV